MTRLCIADPPYPPGSSRPRASRWYGQLHPAAAEWDDPARHRALLAELVAGFDGWALATTPDGLDIYRPLPRAARLMIWHKTNATPTRHRIHNKWEPVIVLPPVGRRNSRGVGATPDVLTAAAPRCDFVGAKPPAWTRWVLDALSYDPDTDTLTDLFPGSGAVSASAAQLVLR